MAPVRLKDWSGTQVQSVGYGVAGLGQLLSTFGHQHAVYGSLNLGLDHQPLALFFVRLLRHGPDRLVRFSSRDRSAEIARRLSHHEGGFPSHTFGSGALIMTPLPRPTSPLRQPPGLPQLTPA